MSKIVFYVNAINGGGAERVMVLKMDTTLLWSRLSGIHGSIRLRRL